MNDIYASLHVLAFDVRRRMMPPRYQNFIQRNYYNGAIVDLYALLFGIPFALYIEVIFILKLGFQRAILIQIALKGIHLSYFSNNFLDT